MPSNSATVISLGYVGLTSNSIFDLLTSNLTILESISSEFDILNIEMELKNSNFTLQTKDDLLIIGRVNSLKRCFLNIIQNGLVYGEKVHAYAEKTANRVVIVFEDDGPGINKKDYDKAVKPFIRLDSSRNQNIPGSGLGLSISQDITSNHGGKLVMSRSDMGGLKVKLKFSS